jgi:hypothetical protein
MKKIMKGLVLGGIILGAMFIASVQTAKAQEDAQLRAGDIRCPDQVRVDRSETVTVRTRNTGETTWIGKSKYFLRISITRGPSGSAVQRDELTPFTVLPDDVKPNEYYTFSLKIEGPTYTGSYTLQFQMSNNGRNFGDKATCNIQVVR